MAAGDAWGLAPRAPGGTFTWSYTLKLTSYFDYSLRVLIYLGKRPEELATIGEIAGHFNISRNHLIKVVHQLGIKGFILTTRGRNGGMVLARPASQIGIGDLTRAMEPDFDLLECFNDAENQCILSAECSMKSIVFGASQAFLTELDRYTLDDIVKKSAAHGERRVSRGKIIPILPVRQRLRLRRNAGYTVDQN